MDGSGSASARGYEFEEFVGQLLRKTYRADAESPRVSADVAADFEVRSTGRPLLVETKVSTPQTKQRLERLIGQVKAVAEIYQREHGEKPQMVLAFPGVLTQENANQVTGSGVEIWDGPHLTIWADNAGVSVPPYVTWFPDESDGDGVAHRPPDEGSFARRLRNITPGPKGWPAYEKFCEELLNYLFVPPLNSAIPQSRDASNTNRRDFVLPNYASHGFWQFMLNHYRAHYIPAEVKNLTGPPGKGAILQVANYLNPHGTGLFALILARKQIDATARWICREQWLLHDKLIIGLDDRDVRQMVYTKHAGGDPAELIRQKIEEFRLAI